LTISLSIASFFSILTFNMNVLEAFKKTLEAFSGRATLEIYTPKVGIPEDSLEAVRQMPEVEVAAPVVRGMILLEGLKDLPVQVVGIDPFSDGAIRSYDSAQDNIKDPLTFLTSPKSVIIPERLAERLGIQPGDAFRVVTPSGTRTLELKGVVREVGPAKIFGGEVLIMDYWAAQSLLHKGESIDEISVLARKGVPVPSLTARLALLLPDYVHIEEPV
jgi:putative ABC transport system permease protein